MKDNETCGNIYVRHELNPDAIKDLEDCKRILKFICGIVVRPAPKGTEYHGFDLVKEYFK